MTMAQSLIEELRKDWIRIASSVVRKRGKRLEDLRFAKRTTHGYAFFLAKKPHWDILHEITQELAKLYPHFDYALVAETSSELANTYQETI